MKRLGWRTGFGCGMPLAMAAGIAFAGPVAVTLAAVAPPVGTDGKPLAFNVVSIREDNSVSTPQSPAHNGSTPEIQAL
jgi:hypothetical protein